jgi:hypothetical protein
MAAVEGALGRLRARLTAADAAAGGFWAKTGDWLFDAFSFEWTGSGGEPREDVRRAATSRRLLDVLTAKRNELIDVAPGALGPDDDGYRHEEALEIVTIANRAAGWDRATSITQMRADTDVPGAVGDAAKRVVEAAAGVPWGSLLTIAAVLAVLVLVWPILGPLIAAGRRLRRNS